MEVGGVAAKPLISSARMNRLGFLASRETAPTIAYDVLASPFQNELLL